MELLQGFISFVLGLSFCLLALGDEMVQTKYVAVGESELRSYMESQCTRSSSLQPIGQQYICLYLDCDL